MRIRLKVVEGALRTKEGRGLGVEIPIPVTRFFIGTDPDCHMRCLGQSISAHHCMILIEDDRVVIRDDASQGGTFVNGTRIDTTACLYHGDRLRVGKLEFEVLMPARSAARMLSEISDATPTAQRETVSETTDTIAELIVEMLMTEDDAERDRRRFDPAAREFHIDQADDAAAGKHAPAPETPTKPPKRPPLKLPPAKLPPAKLPGPPPVRGTDTVDAAEQALVQLLKPANKKNEPEQKPG